MPSRRAISSQAGCCMIIWVSSRLPCDTSAGIREKAKFHCDRPAASATLTLLPTLFFTAATALTLVPSPLIEPRYFIVPFVLLRLHLRPRPGSPSPSPTASRMTTLRRRRLLVELACYVAVNIATIWLFVYKPFRWPAPRTQDETGLMRFMW